MNLPTLHNFFRTQAGRARLLVLVATPLLSVGAHGERRALVIGNDNYRQVNALQNARADAKAIANALSRAGFKADLRLDLDEKGMKSALRDFKRSLSGGDEAVFFFAGHGVQLGTSNYLLPVDIRGENEEQVKDDSIALQRVLDDLQEQRVRFTLAIVDACRDNPFKGQGRALGGRGLAPTMATTGQVVLFSAGTGQQALDRLDENDRNPNGLFTRVFIKAMEQPGVPVDRVLRNVRNEVVQLARSVGHEQVPALYDQAVGDYYFYPPVAGLVPQLPAAPLPELALLDAFPPSAGPSRRQDDASPAPVQIAAAPASPPPRPAAAGDCPDCPEMVRIPAGSFLMGSPETETGRSGDEGPLHRVTLPAYYLGKYEVTQGQWKALMGSNPSFNKSCGDTCPVENVSWDEVQEYIRRLNQKSGRRYRLPSEAEWEYAARANTTTPFWTGPIITTSQANFNGNFTYNDSPKGIARGKSLPVGSLPANPFGLHDIHGNVWEWTQDCWHDSYAGAPTEGSPWLGGPDCGQRVQRGGSWGGNPLNIRSAVRNRAATSARGNFTGFRLARDEA